MQSPTLFLRAAPSLPPLVQSTPNGETYLSIRLIMGTQLFGVASSWLLLGFVATQTYTYSISSANDHPVFKLLVYSIIFLVITQTAVEGFVSYGFLVAGWGVPLQILAEPSHALAVLTDLQPLFDAIPAIVVQFFFTWRIWTFGMAICGRRVKLLVAFVCLFIALTSILAFAAALILIVVFLHSITTPSGQELSQIAITIWTVSTAVADVTITVCMMAFLYHAKSRSWFGEMRDRISRLLRLTIQTGFLTSVLAIPVAPLFYRVHSGIYTLTCFLLGKSYAISLLANLNARSYRPPPPELTGEPDSPHLPTLTFKPHRKRRSKMVDGTTANRGILSSMRSVANTMYHDLTESQSDSAGSSGQGTRYDHRQPPGLARNHLTKEDVSEEVSV